MAEVLPMRPRTSLGHAVPEPPSHLTEDSQAMWRAVLAEWVLGADALPLLRAALEMWDTYQGARAMLAESGPVMVHPTSGAPTAHPAHAVARDSLREFRQLWRQLGLEPPVVA